MKLIGLFSFAPQSGKTTVARHLETVKKFCRIPMAETIKRMMREMMLDCGMTHEEIDKMEAGNKAYPFSSLSSTTLRRAYQTLGTEWGRNCIDPDIWLNIWNRKVNEHMSVWGEGVVCDDIRFENEFNRVLNMGGEMWCITRGANIRPAHASESYEPSMNKFTHVIHNDGDFKDLINKIETLL